MAWREQANFKNVTIEGTTSIAGTLSVAGKVTASVPLQLPVYTVATLPTGAAGQVAFTTDGAQGSPSIVWHDGTNWIEEDGTTAAAS